MKLKLSWWWFIAPSYLTLWTIVFSIWNLIDGFGMMEAFGVDVGKPTEFIMLNSASRYLAIGVGMILGIWVFRTFHSILTALLIRLAMDLGDLYSGFAGGLIQDFSGLFQCFIMFLLPNIFAIATLRRFEKSNTHSDDT